MGLVLLTSAVQAADDPLAWPPVTSQTRPWTWWWWHGSAVDGTNVARELRSFRDAGLGGVQITAIYGVQGAEAREIAYLTPEWLKMLGRTVDEAQRLGMGVNMTLGAGWCFGGPTISEQDANAGVGVKTFKPTPGGRLDEMIDPKSTQALVAFSTNGWMVELTDQFKTNKEISLPPDQSWTVCAISQKPSGRKVKRAAPGGEGWMLNPIYPQALTNWLQWFDVAFAAQPGSRPQAVFQDSYEYRSEWAPDFFAQFEKRRGYQLQSELPALFANTSNSLPLAIDEPDRIGRVKYDYRRTVSEIMVQESGPAWIDWAHRRGFRTVYQAHGAPGNWLDLYGAADIPETEMFREQRSILVSKFASSAAHTQGRPLVGAETGTWVSEHFTETLADLKRVADDLFLSGVNHVYHHGTCYSPADAAWPGWLFYASTEMNPRNPIWRDVPALNAYLTRCQSVLQSGRPDNDVLLYWPVADFWSQPEGLLQSMGIGDTNWFQGQSIGASAGELWRQGYAFDYVSDAQLLQAKVVDGSIRMPGGDYKVIVVPPAKYMPIETLKCLFALIDQGATVWFQSLICEAPGWRDHQKQTAEMIELWREHTHEKDFWQRGIGALFQMEKAGRTVRLYKIMQPEATGIPHETMTEHDLQFVRRSFDGGWHYFIVNRGERAFDGWVALARPAGSVVILDPMTGSTGMAESRISKQGTAEVRLQLAAGESLILRAFADKQAKGPAWPYWRTNGRPMEITGNWNVKFIAGGPVCTVRSPNHEPSLVDDVPGHECDGVRRDGAV